jgi:hypothetical protein
MNSNRGVEREVAISSIKQHFGQLEHSSDHFQIAATK